MMRTFVCSIIIPQPMNGFSALSFRVLLFTCDRIYKDCLQVDGKMPLGCCIPDCTKKGSRDKDGSKVFFF